MAVFISSLFLKRSNKIFFNDLAAAKYHTHGQTWLLIPTATLTQQKYVGLNFGSTHSCLPHYSSCPAHAWSWSVKLKSYCVRLLMASLSLTRDSDSRTSLSSEQPPCMRRQNVKSTRLGCTRVLILGPSLKNALVVIRRRQRLANAMESDPWCVSAYCISQSCVLRCWRLIHK
jgi:hypothetical protein